MTMHNKICALNAKHMNTLNLAIIFIKFFQDFYQDEKDPKLKNFLTNIILHLKHGGKTGKQY